MKAFKYRLYPTHAQGEKLDWILARCCELYNAALQERKDAWNACKNHPNFHDPEWRTERARDYRITYYDQANALPDLKQDLRPEYCAIGAHVLQDVLRRVDKAFQAFFRRVRCGQTPGYPRYQSRTRYDSFTFPDQAGWKLSGNRLTLTNIGTIKVKLHREVQGTIKTCMIKPGGGALVCGGGVRGGSMPTLALYRTRRWHRYGVVALCDLLFRRHDRESPPFAPLGSHAQAQAAGACPQEAREQPAQESGAAGGQVPPQGTSSTSGLPPQRVACAGRLL